MQMVKAINSIKTSKFFYYWLPVFVYAGLIFYLSSLSTVPAQIIVTTKDWVLHMIEYAILSMLLLRAFGKSENTMLKFEKLKPESMTLKNWAAILAILIATIYGITDEIHQYFVPGRVMSGFDIVADFLGSIIAVVTIMVLSTKFLTKSKFKFSKVHFRR